MSNPSADYPAALHTRPDLSAVGNAALGDTSPTHADVHGKAEEEIYQIQRKIGTGDASATSAAAGEVLTADGLGNTSWVVPEFDQEDLDASLEALTNKLGGGTPSVASEHAVLVGTDTGESVWATDHTISVAHVKFGLNGDDPRIYKDGHKFIQGYDGAEGASIETYDFAHATRPGEVAIVYGGAVGQGPVRFIHFDGVDYHTILETTDKKVQTNKAFISAPVSLTDAATVATDCSKGNTFMVTIAGNRTIGSPTNAVDGQRITYRIDQDGTGGHSITWDAAFHFSSDVPEPSLPTWAGARSYITFVFDNGYGRFDCLGWSRGY